MVERQAESGLEVKELKTITEHKQNRLNYNGAVLKPRYFASRVEG